MCEHSLTPLDCVKLTADYEILCVLIKKNDLHSNTVNDACLFITIPQNFLLKFIKRVSWFTNIHA